MPTYAIQRNAEESSVVKELDSLLMPKGVLVAVPTRDLLRFKQEDLSVYGHLRGIYQYPTTELVELLRHAIGGRKAIEIAAGNGIIGRQLGIPMTDSFMQKRPEIVELYRSLGQPVIEYPEDVQKFDAMAALDHFAPQVVVGCWATHLWKEGMDTGNMYGIPEEELIKRVELYVHVGNAATHASKPSLETCVYEEVRAPFLITRSMHRAENNMYIFRGGMTS